MATSFTSINGYRNENAKSTGLRKVIHGTMVTDGGDGAVAGDIPASVFGLTVIEEISPAVKSDNSLIVVLAPAYSSTAQGSSVIGKAAATAAAADIPSGTYAVTVKGY
jgi:hypothetical protein